MTIHHTEPVEKYILVAMFGALIAVHSAMLVSHLSEPAVPDSLNFTQGGIVLMMVAFLVWLVREPW